MWLLLIIVFGDQIAFALCVSAVTRSVSTVARQRTSIENYLKSDESSPSFSTSEKLRRAKVESERTERLKIFQ